MIHSIKQKATVGVLAAALAISSCSGQKSQETTGDEAHDAKPIHWRLTSTYPPSLLILGSMAKRAVETVEEISGGNIKLELHAPGVLTPPFEIFDAVSYGAIETGWSTPGYWAGKIPALQLFSAVPFGPSAPEYLAWYDFGGGREIFEEIYHKHNIHGIICGISPPEAAGWFNKEIKTIEDLQGLKIRFFGLGGKVLEKIGAAPQLIPGGEIYQALELGTIDASEFSMPAVDERMGFNEVASHYYFPGWHQQSTFFELIINLEKWNSLSKTQQSQFEAACSTIIRYSISEGESLQATAIQSLKDKGVQIHTYPDDVLAQLKTAWNETAAELAAEDEDFNRAWTSLQNFREQYKGWSDLGYLKD